MKTLPLINTNDTDGNERKSKSLSLQIKTDSADQEKTKNLATDKHG